MIGKLQGRVPAFTLLLILGGCSAAPTTGPGTVSATPARPILSSAGLEGVMGRTAGILSGLFGKADLDVREGAARKLQFASPACVLDTYLYPPAAGGEPIVNHIDARLPDGRDFDRASCVAALQAQKAAR